MWWTETGLRRRLARLREAHNAARIVVSYCEPFGRPRWNIDADIFHMGGPHRIGAAATLREAVKQAEEQVPGATIPLHTGREDQRTCRACPHFRVAHGRDYCRIPGCDCQGYRDTRERVSA